MMRPTSLLLPMALSAALLALSGCSKESPSATSQDPQASEPIALPQAHEVLAAQARGFTAGQLMSAQAVYVLFDPQCPHCARLWESSQPLLGKVKFVWVPVAILNAKSAPQGAALLTAANPVEAMAEHERMLLAGQGGISASANVPDDVRQAIERNTTLLTRLGADSVPFIVARNPRTSQNVTQSGALPTAALAELIGVNLQP